MKLILFLLIPFILFAQTGDIETQDFEGAGTPLNWSNGGTPNYDYTTDPLEKLQSLEIDVSNEIASYSLGADSTLELYGFCIFRYEQAAAGTNFFIGLFGNGAEFGRIYLRDGTRLQLNLAGGNGLGTADLVINTKYYLWFYYKRSTGADGIFRAWRGTSPNKPLNPDVNLTVHTATDTVSRIDFKGDTDIASTFFDYVVLSTSEIGNFSPDVAGLYKAHKKEKIYKGY